MTAQEGKGKTKKSRRVHGLDEPEVPVVVPTVTVMPDDSVGFRLAERAAYHLFALKGEDIVILDLRGLSDVCDFFVLASGQADTQVKAMARAARTGLAAVGQKAIGSEGEAEGRWALLDFVDVVVHIFRHEVRQYYQLERLWGDAGALTFTIGHLTGEDFRRRHPDLALGDVSRGAPPTEKP
jgi:ribosome-associated protein